MAWLSPAAAAAHAANLASCLRQPAHLPALQCSAIHLLFALMIETKAARAQIMWLPAFQPLARHPAIAALDGRPSGPGLQEHKSLWQQSQLKCSTPGKHPSYSST